MAYVAFAQIVDNGLCMTLYLEYIVVLLSRDADGVLKDVGAT